MSKTRGCVVSALLILSSLLSLPAAVPAVAQEQWFAFTAKHTGMCMDVYEAWDSSGTAVIQWPCHYADNQQWQLVPAGFYYRLVARNSGKCLDVAGSSRSDGAQVVQWACNGGSNQSWRLLSAGNGYYRIVARHSGKCLDVEGGSSASGAHLVQWDCSGGDSQLWLQRTIGTSGTITPAFSEPVSDVGSSVQVGAIGPNEGQHLKADLYAVDYLGARDTPVRPALAGRVVYSGERPDYGWVVAIRHWDDSRWDRKYYSIYAHLTENGLPQVGELVDPSTVIGYMGDSGSGAGGVVHLHFAVRSSDKAYSSVQAVVYGKNWLGQLITPAFDVREQFGYPE